MGVDVKPDLKWLILKMATLPITRQDWAFVFEVWREESTQVAWKVDPNRFGRFERASERISRCQMVHEERGTVNDSNTKSVYIRTPSAI